MTLYALLLWWDSAYIEIHEKLFTNYKDAQEAAFYFLDHCNVYQYHIEKVTLETDGLCDNCRILDKYNEISRIMREEVD